MSSILNNINKLHLINDKTILETKRGKNNPSHVFMKPRCTQDPTRQKLDRVIQAQAMPNSNVAVGTYDTDRYQTMGRAEAGAKLEEIVRKKKGTEFSMLKLEDGNRAWIDRARKEYMGSRVYAKAGVPSVAQFLVASGFDPAEYDLNAK